MAAYTVADLRALVRPDRVHRDIYRDPAIFALEMERIFSRTWIYVGHVSQVPKAGDFVCTRIGLEPVVMMRHSDGEVYVVRNRCAHRGVRVVNEERGNAKVFMCMYHGWTYRTNGDLDAVSQPEGYPPGFASDPVALGMGRVARVAVHRGFVFASLSPTGPSLLDHLGENAHVLDELCESAPDGEVELAGGVHKYVYRGNWKFQVDNLSDMYHPAYSHESTSRASGQQFTRRKGDDGGIQFFEKPGRPKSLDPLGVHALPNGHSWQGGLPAHENKSPEWLDYLARLESRLGRERARQILVKTRHNVIFYPNLAMQELNPHLRVIRPLAADLTEIFVYPVRLKGAPEQMFRDQIRMINGTHSASSMVQTDDVEAFSRAQQGLQTSGNEWLLYARAGAEETDPKTGRVRSIGTSEIAMRNQYQTWLAHMCRAA
jgi:phenylpropionate dioxygenase-like ring-hydroxylating dioxygenase large terminal subunit